MTYDIDTAIIGGGPAGMSCAITLQKNAVSGVVIEKRAFPRDKTCGGLITNKTVRLLQEGLGFGDTDLSAVICDESNTVALYDHNKLLTRSIVSKRLRFVKRTVFDSYLARQYKELGGNLIENNGCAAIDLSSRKIILANGDIVRFKHLVAADGALSSTRKMLGYKAPKAGFCIETHIPKSKTAYDGAVKIHFGIVKNGYAWVFPSGDDICIGLGGVYQKGIRYDELLKQFLSSLSIDHGACVLKGAFIPYGKIVEQSHNADNAVLVGDAGGFVDPIYGEGLYFALASGIEAANSILSGTARIKPEFIRRTASFARIIRQGAFLQKILFQNGVLKRFKRAILCKNGFVSFYCDNQISEYNYSYAGLLRLCRDYKRRKNGTNI